VEALESRVVLNLDLAQYINPLIGTALQAGAPFGAGDTFPGADVPFGMVQWSPDTTTNNPGGYDYANNTIKGFSITHFSGRGVNYLQDIPIMPIVGTVTTSPVTNPSLYYSTFSHANESASAGYYGVQLNNGVQAELTVTQRSGLGQFTFPATPTATLIVNSTGSVNGNSAGGFTVVDSNDITGYATSHIGAASNPYTIYFSISFDRPIISYGTWNGATVSPGSSTSTGPQSGGYVTFDTTNDPVVHVKVGLSYVSVANAQLNALTEDPGWDFDAVRQAAYDAWNNELNVIQVQGGTPDEMATFYTALYHSLIHPNVFSDVNGQYIGFDNVVRTVPPGHAHYENIPGWDQYRSQEKLLPLIDPGVASDVAQSLIDDAQQGGGAIPRWQQGNADSRGMVGDGGSIIIADIYSMGATDFDTQAALAAMDFGASNSNAQVSGHTARENLTDYLNLGYVASNHNGESAAVTLEYANADFAIAQFAQALGDTDLYNTYLQRSQDWKNLYDPATGYITPRDSSGNFQPNFSPTSGSGFAEGDSAQYTWMIPYDFRGLFDAMGGNAAAVARLDVHYTQLNGGTNSPFGFMGNEPEEGGPWAYDFAGAPWRTQDVARRIQTQLFLDTPGGLPGNDDAGAISSWYVFSALGLYPEIQGVGGFVIGSPLFSSITMNLPGGQTVQIDAPNAAPANPYVQDMQVNGVDSTSLWLPIDTILNNATTTLSFDLGSTPNTNWGSAPTDAPPSFDIPAALMPPGAVTASAGDGAVTLTWAVSPGATSYNVYRGTLPGGEGSTPIASGVTTTSFMDNGLTNGTTYYYFVTAVNDQGESGPSREVSATPDIASMFDYSNGFADPTSLTLNGSASISGSRLRLTDTGTYEAGTAFFSTLVPVQAFTTSFVFQLHDGTPFGDQVVGNGITFIIQSNGTTALGGTGGGLGYGPDPSLGGAGIPNSIAVKFDTTDNEGEGPNSTGLYLDGVAPTVPAVDLRVTPINLHSGDPFEVDLSYDGSTLTETITDQVTMGTYTQSYTVNIPAVVGGDVAYVGFGGGTGLHTASQDILQWTFQASTGGTGTAASVSRSLVAAPVGWTVPLGPATTGVSSSPGQLTSNGTAAPRPARQVPDNVRNSLALRTRIKLTTSGYLDELAASRK
jgi:predicted alpha-1,2-mannosidase